MNATLRKRLTWTEKNPRKALENGWVQDPEFCRAFFDRCDHLAFVLSPATFDLALRAVEFAEAHGDPHLLHRSHGVLSHAFIIRGDLFWAGRTLAGVRKRALDCCPACRCDLLRREGDLLGERRHARESLAALDAALEEGGHLLTADDRARVFYCRAVAHHFLGNRGRALRDARRTLMELSLDSPRGYFLDTAAFLAIYVAGGDPRHDEYAATCFRDFSERIKGRKDWNDMNTRSAWSGGHLSARLGDFRRAGRQLKSAWIQLRYNGLARELVAATVDRCQLICRGIEPRWQAPENAIELIDTCLTRQDLTDDHRRGLKEMKGVLDDWPENAFEELVGFRRSFIAPVPGVMAERIGVR
ncbi:MAG: hypothetical protein GY719_43240 [bacterium]|nr:hypothetical protein [bacterium]